MSSYTGKAFRLNRFASPTYYDLGGKPLGTPEIRMPTESIDETGTSQRKLTTLETIAVKPALAWTMDVRVLADYIIGYAFVTAEGDVPAHTLYGTDGAEAFGFSDCKVNRCEITIRQAETIRAIIEVLAKDHSVPTLGTLVEEATVAMTKKNVTTFTIAGVAVDNWSEIAFGIDNKVAQDHLGIGLMPSEVYEQEARYSGHLIRSRKAASKFSIVKAGTKETIVIALQDRQATPVTKTFTFTNALLKSSVIQVPELRLELERIEWLGDSLTIT